MVARAALLGAGTSDRGSARGAPRHLLAGEAGTSDLHRAAGQRRVDTRDAEDRPGSRARFRERGPDAGPVWDQSGTVRGRAVSAVGQTPWPAFGRAGRGRPASDQGGLPWGLPPYSNGPARLHRMAAQISGMIPKPMKTGVYE